MSGFTETHLGRIAHHQHHSGLFLVVKTALLDGKVYPVRKPHKNNGLLYCFALPGGREVWIPQQGVRITTPAPRRDQS